MVGQFSEMMGMKTYPHCNGLIEDDEETRGPGMGQPYKGERGKGVVFYVIVSLVGATIILTGLYAGVTLRAFKVPSLSMAPTLLPGDRIVVNKRYKKVKRGDVIAFRSPRNPSHAFAKRVIGLPGEVIEIKNKVVYINGEAPEEPYAHSDTWNNAVRKGFLQRDYPPITVPENACYVLGDDRGGSEDSRHWGCVPRENIIGKVLFIYFSIDPVEKHVRWKRMGLAVK
jgi:signal peptidase I